MAAEEIPLTIASMRFNTYALEEKKKKEAELPAFLKTLEKGVNKDWEHSHIVWGRDPPKDKRTGKTLPPEEWPAQLLDPGTANIMGFMGVRPRHIDEKVETDIETGLMRATMKTELVTILPIMYPNLKTGEPVPYHPAIAEGVGACSTKEKRFKVTWSWQKEKNLKTSEGYSDQELEDYRTKYPDRYRAASDPKYDNLYYMLDPESLGMDNSLLKMAAKRSEMDAVFQIPGVAQRFSQEIDIVDTALGSDGSRVVIPPLEPKPEEEPEPEEESEEEPEEEPEPTPEPVKPKTPIKPEKPAMKPVPENDYAAMLDKVGVPSISLLNIEMQHDTVIVTPKKFLADYWGPINDKIKEIGGDWVRDGRNSRFEIPLAELEDQLEG